MLEYSHLEKYVTFPNEFTELAEKYGYTDLENLGFFNFENVWAFFTVDDIMSRKEIWEKEKYIDLGIAYHGMGHYVILSIVKETGKFFFRIDGGSSTWERVINQQIFTGHNPSDGKIFDFDEMKKILKIEDINYISVDIFQEGDKKKINLRDIINS